MKRGYTLVEMMMVTIIIGIGLAIVIPSLLGSIRRRSLESILLDISGSLKKSRADALETGIRTVTVIGTGTDRNLPFDFDNDGRQEHYITFIDNDRDGNFSTQTDRVLYRNFFEGIEIATNTLGPETGSPTGRVIFLPQGIMIEGIGMLSIRFPEHDTLYSLEVISLLGATRIRMERL